MEAAAESSVISLNFGELAVSPKQVARYAGGARYRAAPSQRENISAVLEQANRLVNPAFVYSVREVSRIGDAGGVSLDNRTYFHIPGEADPGIKYLAFCICTIGPALEEEAQRIMSGGDLLSGLFLDAAGVAFLESLGSNAHEHLRDEAHKHGLHAGCRFGPGYGGLDLSIQNQLFGQVDASAIGVRLNESCVMTPAKSLSFFTKWTTSETPESGRYKCSLCNLQDCPYRV